MIEVLAFGFWAVSIVIACGLVVRAFLWFAHEPSGRHSGQTYGGVHRVAGPVNPARPGPEGFCVPGSILFPEARPYVAEADPVLEQIVQDETEWLEVLPVTPARAPDAFRPAGRVWRCGFCRDGLDSIPTVTGQCPWCGREGAKRS